MKQICSLSWIFSLLLCMGTNAFAGGKGGSNVTEQGSPSALENPASFRGAELYANFLGSDKIKIFLKEYFDYGANQFSETEAVSLQESELMMSKKIVLNKDSIVHIENLGAQSSTSSNSGRTTMVIYSTEIDLGTAHANYDITWGYVFMNKSEFANLDDKVNQGFALATHVTNEGRMMPKNAMPSLSALPTFILKPNTNGSMVIKPIDPDGDMSSVEISAPYSLLSNSSNKNMQNNNIPVLKQGSIITGKSPLKTVQYKSGYSIDNPINAKIFSIDKNTGMFKYEARNQIGKYLAAITIKEIKDNNIISEHQCVFIIDVQ